MENSNEWAEEPPHKRIKLQKGDGSKGGFIGWLQRHQNNDKTDDLVIPVEEHEKTPDRYDGKVFVMSGRNVRLS